MDESKSPAGGRGGAGDFEVNLDAIGVSSTSSAINLALDTGAGGAMKRIQTILFGLLVALANFASAADELPPLNGHWLVRALEAHARVASRRGTNDDLVDSTLLVGVTAGVIATHRQNNLMLALIYSSVESAYKKAPEKNPPTTNSDQLRVAFAYSPLFGLPDDFKIPQVFAIFRRFLEANPERWGEPAYPLIIAALRDSIRRSDSANR